MKNSWRDPAHLEFNFDWRRKKQTGTANNHRNLKKLKSKSKNKQA
jgi:hypothetical protein